MPIYPYSFTLPPVNKQDIPSDGVAGEFLGISAGGVLDWLPVSGGSGSGDLLAANNLSELTPTSGTARTNLGLGTGDSPTFANLTLTSPSLSSSAPVTISQTWDQAVTLFTALKVNATSTSSLTTSRLLDLQAGGVSKFNVDRTGNINVDPTNGSAFLTFKVGAGTAFQYYGGSGWGSQPLNVMAAAGLSVSQGILQLGVNTILLRDGADNTLALRNGAAAQTFRVYNTFPGTGNNEFGSLNWVDQPNEFQITTGQAGSGTGRALCLRAGGGINIRIGGAPGTLVWQFGTSTGHFLAGSDNSVDIGASGANRPRNVYAGTSFLVASTVIANQVAAGTYLGVRNNSVYIDAPSSGVLLLLDSASTSFGRLQLGGTTDAFPAIARDGAGIKFTGGAAGSTSWIKVPPVAVGSLPVAATAGAGARAFVNDASAPVFGSAVTGGGAVLVPVYCTGSAWNVG